MYNTLNKYTQIMSDTFQGRSKLIRNHSLSIVIKNTWGQMVRECEDSSRHEWEEEKKKKVLEKSPKSQKMTKGNMGEGRMDQRKNGQMEGKGMFKKCHV